MDILFSQLGHKEISKILDLINPIWDGSDFLAENTSILAQNLNFYPGYRLLEISRQDNSQDNNYKLFAIQEQKNTTKPYLKIINWTNEPIYETNAHVPIKLSEDTLRDYIRFFLRFVHGRRGRLQLIESMEDMSWREAPPAAAGRAITKMISPMELVEFEQNKGWRVRLCVVFGDSLYRLRIDVNINGHVDIEEEEIIIEDMPVFEKAL